METEAVRAVETAVPAETVTEGEKVEAEREEAAARAVVVKVVWLEVVRAVEKVWVMAAARVVV